MSSASPTNNGRAAGGSRYEDAPDSDDYDLRPSAELSDADHDLLESEDERERLLTQKEGISGLFSSGVKIGTRGNGRKKAEMAERKRGLDTGASTPTYDTEEGVGESSSSLLRSGRSSQSDEQRLLAARAQKKVRLGARAGKMPLTLCEGEAIEAMAKRLYLHIDLGLLFRPACVRIPSFDSLERPARSISSDCPLERDLPLRTYDDPDLARWVSRRLPVSQSHTYAQSVCSRRHLPEVHATQLSQRDVSKSLHNGDWTIPRSARNRE